MTGAERYPDPGLALGSRAGLPAELLFLADSHPRSTWNEAIDLGGMASFWLQRHDMFRQMGGLLTGIIADHREDRLDAPAFAQAFAPRLQVFLGELDGHHHIEDHHYFPIFVQAEKRLSRGFALLDADHHIIHEALERNAEAANGFLRALQGTQDERRRFADLYADANESLVRMLTRHLEDEEDLIIPLILDRGESRLFR